MTDVVEQIRERVRVWSKQAVSERVGPQRAYCRDVTALLARIDRLEKALRKIQKLTWTLDAPIGDEARLNEASEIATAALEESDES